MGSLIERLLSRFSVFWSKIKLKNDTIPFDFSFLVWPYTTPMKRRKRIPEITISKYRYTRFWAVWIDEELLAVVCYKKGANAIRELLLKLFK